MRGPKRRDIGHGALAQRALEAVIPTRGGVPVHDPPRLRDARVERLVVDGLGLRLDARADGRRRADQGAGRRHRDGPRQGGRRLRHPHRHPGRGGPPRRHGLQGRRHPRGHHRPPDGHQDHRRHAGDHALGARAGEAGARVHPRQDGRGDPRVAHASSPSTRRGSRRSRSTPSSSAWSSARAARRSARSRPTTTCRSTSRRTGRSSSTRPRARSPTPRSPRSTALTKEPEVGDDVHRQGRQDDAVRRVRRAEEGHRRPAPRLERRPGPGRPHRGRDRRAATCST